MVRVEEFNLRGTGLTLCRVSDRQSIWKLARGHRLIALMPDYMGGRPALEHRHRMIPDRGNNRGYDQYVAAPPLRGHDRR
jgi:hypothetical protein